MSHLVLMVLSALGAQAPANDAVLCLAESSAPGIVLVGMTDKWLVVDGAKGSILLENRQVEGPVTAIAVDKKRGLIAMAMGKPASNNVIDILEIDAKGMAGKKIKRISGLGEQAYALAFQPGPDALLASAGYGREISIWDTSSGKETLKIRDHSDSVRGLDWHPSGRWLASCSCDRTVKIWDMPSGRCAHSIGDATDWVYSARWIEGGAKIAAGGVDRSLRAWELNADKASLKSSAFAHQAAVLSLGATSEHLLTLGEDGWLKKWKIPGLAASGKLSVPSLPPSCLLVSNSLPLAWIGDFEGRVHAVNIAEMKIVKSLLMRAAPRVMGLEPTDIQRGMSRTVRVTGLALDKADWKKAVMPGCEFKLTHVATDGASVVAEVSAPQNALPGKRQVSVPVPGGEALTFSLTVVLGSSGIDSKGMAAGTASGTIARAGQVDRFPISLRRGQPLGLLLEQDSGSQLDCQLSMAGPDGSVALQGNRALAFVAEVDGIHEIQVRDREYRVGTAGYRLHAGQFPVVQGVFPSHVEAGKPAKVRLLGVGLGDHAIAEWPEVPASSVGGRLTLPSPWEGIPGASGPFVDPSPQVMDRQVIHVPPFGANGILETSVEANRWKFQATRGKKLVIEVKAARMGSPFDSSLAIRDAKGNPLVRARLEPVDQTTVAFRNHDAKNPGIRLDKWTGFSPNDFLYAGGDVMRIRALPRNPDDDCQFFAQNGKRLAWLGTSPNQHPVGQALIKVIPRRPDETIEGVGISPIELPWANDDGDPETGTDSKLLFDPPADGILIAEVSDASGRIRGGLSYHLAVRPVLEDFSISPRLKEIPFSPDGSAEVVIDILRRDGWEGAVKAEMVGLPEPWIGSAGKATAMENSLTLAISAAGPGAMFPVRGTIRATGTINGTTQTREMPLPPIRLGNRGDVTVRAMAEKVEIAPGSRAKVPVRIERHNGFAGRVPLDVRGLPQGVRVLDIGLNGVLVPPNQTERTLEIEVDPWLEPVTLPFVVTARKEGQAEFVGKPVTLVIGKRAQ